MRLREGVMVNCPMCDAVIDVDEEELDEGDSLICEDCGANLSVSSVSPLELTPETEVELHFLQRVRDEIKFPSVEALRHQIALDVKKARRYFHLLKKD